MNENVIIERNKKRAQTTRFIKHEAYLICFITVSGETIIGRQNNVGPVRLNNTR